jgi:Zn-dependent metalloprotease
MHRGELMAKARIPLNCILPPHMLRSMYTNGTPSEKRSALVAIVGTARFRGQRQALVESGANLSRIVAGGKRRRVYTASNGTTLPGRLVRDEAALPTGDAAVDEAYDGAGATYDLYWQTYQRDSLDGAGLRIDSTVHYQQDYDNAFWDGRQMVYGDGDGRLFNRFTMAVDVIGHELTHGVTQYTSNLNYSNQPGALNESFSDVFGSLVKQRQRGQTASEADWLIGAGLFTSRVKGAALRSMKEPGTAYDDPILGKDPQPGHMRDYVQMSEDNGGVHINSGIPNHAFYLTAVALGGNAWERAGKVWYVAARDRFSSNTDFQSAANLTHEVAGDIFGVGSSEQQAVAYGWDGVGVSVGGSAPPPAQPNTSESTGCLAALIQLLQSLSSNHAAARR